MASRGAIGPKLTQSTFASLGLAEALLRALADIGHTTPTPIQSQAIQPALAGRDVLGIAQTGTGKTAAFALPILQHLSAERMRPSRGGTRTLILAPTRELALQIEASIVRFARHLKIKTVTLVGGVARRPQVQRLASGTDILVGTPGRVLDLLSTGDLHLDLVTHFVLDEADRMLDLGFVNDIKRIAAKLPQRRQTLLFSATMPNSVVGLANGLLNKPERIEVSQATIAPSAIDQRVYYVPKADKRRMLIKIIGEKSISRAIVFTRTKHEANRVAEHLGKEGISADAIHSNKSQSARQNSLERFKKGKSRVLVATDIASRGIDIADVSHVFNYDVPDVAESYVHRIGRTARAGAGGVAIALCDGTEIDNLRAIERLVGKPLTHEGGAIPAREPAPSRGGGQRKPANANRNSQPKQRRRRYAA
jgi:ATP-dependent RNA helicase RhlE